MLHFVQLAVQIAAVARRGVRGGLRASLRAGPAPASGTVAAPEQGGRPALPMRRRDIRGVCPIPVLFTGVHKGHPA